MQRRGRLPGLVAHAGDEFTHRAGGTQRDPSPVAGERVAIGREAGDLHLQALHRGIDVAHRAARRALLAHDVPGLERLAQLDLGAEHARSRRTSESGIRSAARTTRLRAESRRWFCSAITSAKSRSTKYGSMKRSCSSVPQRASRGGLR